MQLNQLRYFTTLADTRHFTHAAERCDVAQPTLSQQIRALERDLGTTLVNRVPGGVELTAAGQELLPIARRIVADAETARRAVDELSDLRRGRVRLGATPSLLGGVAAGVVARFRGEYPSVAIVIAEGGSRGLRAQVQDGDLDLALLVDSRAGDTAAERSSAGDDGLLLTPLFVEELVLISPPDTDAPTRRSRVGIEELRGVPLVMFREGYDLRQTTIAACRAHGFEPEFAVEGGEMDAVLSFVAAGIGVALVPRSVAAPDRFRVTPLRSPGLGRTIRLARRTGIELPRAAAELERHLLDLTA